MSDYLERAREHASNQAALLAFATFRVTETEEND